MVSVKFTSLLASFTLFSNVLATVFLTSPTAQTACTGTKVCTISWEDDGKAPSLTQFGLASIGVWVGSVTNQTELQHIQDGVNVATTSAVQFTVNPAIGPNSAVYFVRFTSQALKDNTTGFPVEAFSAKFNLNGMSGQFSPSVQAQIDGASASPVPTPSAAPSGSSSAAASTKPTSSSSASTGSSSTASANGAAKTGAAVSNSVKNSMAVMVGAGVVAALAL